MRKISSVIMACAMCLSMAVVGTVAPQVAVQAEETAAVELKEAPTETPTLDKDFGYEWYLIQYPEYTANSENTKSWMEKITSIKVNDAEPYTKVDNKFLMKEDTGSCLCITEKGAGHGIQRNIPGRTAAQ